MSQFPNAATGKKDCHALEADLSPNLLRNQLMSGMISGGRHTTFLTAKLNASPASPKSLEELEPVTISNLTLNTHNKGKVLITRTFCEAIRSGSAIVNAIEDSIGDVDRLAVYDHAPSSTPHQTLPYNAIFAIKEPFYKETLDGGHTVRIDNCKDLVMLQPDHALVPAQFKNGLSPADMSAILYKDKGNAAYKAKDHLLAVALNTKGIMRCEHIATKKALLRNRALVNSYCGRYMQAVADGKASQLSEDDMPEKAVRDELNAKSYHRTAFAYEGAKLYSAAAEHARAGS